MYRLYIIDEAGKWYLRHEHPYLAFSSWIHATQFRTIEAANSKAHELNLNEYYIEDEHGETVYPMKPEVIDPTQHEQTK